MENQNQQAVSRLDLVTKLQAMIHQCLKDYIPKEEPLAIVDFPDIRNCGDSAIWLGEMAYLRNWHGKRPSYVSRTRDFSAEALERAMPTGPIFIHGGGNFGDIWLSHQDFRERVLERFPNRLVVQFAQSIHYQSQERIEKSARIIGRHKNFVLLVRDEYSKQFAERHFDCTVKLCPDMAFAIGSLQSAQSKFPVLAMLREDREKAGSTATFPYPDIPREDWITESAISVKISKVGGVLSALCERDTAEVRLRMLDAAAHNRFRRGIRQISRADALVTDRLHVHICALLLGRPHAVLDNNYGKIRRFMSTFSDGTELSYKATSLDDGVAWAREQAARKAN